jgi:hypothetical protein
MWRRVWPSELWCCAQQRSTSPPSLGLKSNPSKKPAEADIKTYFFTLKTEVIWSSEMLVPWTTWSWNPEDCTLHFIIIMKLFGPGVGPSAVSGAVIQHLLWSQLICYALITILWSYTCYRLLRTWKDLRTWNACTLGKTRSQKFKTWNHWRC